MARVFSLTKIEPLPAPSKNVCFFYFLCISSNKKNPRKVLDQYVLI